MKALTARQAEVLDFIRNTIKGTGIPPTIAEIASAMGVKSPNGIREHLQALARKGAVELIPSASRGIRLLVDDKEDPGLPIVGRVPAGSPILAEEHIETHCKLDYTLFKPRPDYLLRVQGMSMRDVGILDGDLLAVHRTVEVRNRQIVVVRLNGEVTVKRLRLAGHIAYLQPENPEFDTIKVDLHQTDLCIEGVVVGVIRNQDL